MSPNAFDIAYDPLIPWGFIAAAAFVDLVLILGGIWRRASGIGWRAGVLLALLAALANPTLVKEERNQKPDVAVVVVDESTSQKIGARSLESVAALSKVTRELGRMRDLDVRVVRVSGKRRSGGLGRTKDGTRLLGAVSRALGDIPRRRLAGVLAITDGQVHDAQDALEGGDLPGPFHVLLT
ncbi:MAG: hypothetical protein P8N43_09000, partial [Alphaproteobacteria bacterium]|nr:hypothetical protein [Alphaproteobacteria bacterium]